MFYQDSVYINIHTYLILETMKQNLSYIIRKQKTPPRESETSKNETTCIMILLCKVSLKTKIELGLSLIMRKAALSICEQQRCARAESEQHLSLPLASLSL